MLLPTVLLAISITIAIICTSLLFVVLRYRKVVAALRQELANKSDGSSSDDRPSQAEEVTKQAAIKANEMKSRFLANMSHELRTPINAILGNLSLLSATQMSQDQFEYASRSQVSGERLLVLVNDILDFSKLQGGELTLENTTLDISECVESSCRVVQGDASAKGIELLSFVSGRVPAKLHGDPGRIKQVLTNLLGNAVKFTDHGFASIVVRLKEMEGKNALLEISVADSGVGMSEDTLWKLFQPFMQGDETTTRKHGGTGLGLAICWHLVKLMHGSIEAKSETNQGSRFSFSIKLPTEEQRPFAPELAGVRIAIIDREPESRKFLHYLFEEQGAVVYSQDTPEALDAKADLIILDLSATDVEYTSDLKKIRERFPSDRTIVTAKIHNDYVEARRICRELGFAYYLAKPFNQRQMVELCRSINSGNFDYNAFENEYGIGKRLIKDASKNFLEVLLVDDHACNQLVGQRMVSSLGHNATVVASGQEAIGLVASQGNGFDIILIDADLYPNGSQETLKQIKSVTSESKIPIYVLTRLNGISNDQAIKEGLEGALAKPINMEILHQTLMRHR